MDLRVIRATPRPPRGQKEAVTPGALRRYFQVEVEATGWLVHKFSRYGVQLLLSRFLSKAKQVDSYLERRIEVKQMPKVNKNDELKNGTSSDDMTEVTEPAAKAKGNEFGSQTDWGTMESRLAENKAPGKGSNFGLHSDWGTLESQLAENEAPDKGADFGRHTDWGGHESNTAVDEPPDKRANFGRHTDRGQTH